MTKGQRTIAALLGAVGVLLALNLVKGEPEAHAQHGPPSAAPTVVGTSAEQIWRNDGGNSGVTKEWKIVRAWSDGQVDIAQVRFTSFESNTVAAIFPPVVVIDPGP